MSPAVAQRGAITVPRNLDELTDGAQDIIRGTVTDARVEKHPELDNLTPSWSRFACARRSRARRASTYTFRQYIWDLRDRSDVAGYRKGQELLLLMNGSSRYGLTSPVGLEQGRFRIQRDRSGREIAIERRGQCAAVRRDCRARRASPPRSRRSRRASSPSIAAGRSRSTSSRR